MDRITISSFVAVRLSRLMRQHAGPSISGGWVSRLYHCTVSRLAGSYCLSNLLLTTTRCRTPLNDYAFSGLQALLIPEDGWKSRLTKHLLSLWCLPRASSLFTLFAN